jgi:hypothetical protein
MTFLNWIMLLGLAGVSIPIVIHLLNRRRARRVEWGAMRFLLEAMASQNRRIFLEELVLLVLRCLLIALLVLAMARPFLPSRAQVPWALVLVAALGAVILGVLAAGAWSYRRQRKWLLGSGIVLALVSVGLIFGERWMQNRRWAPRVDARDIVLVIDASGSMALDVDGRSNFDRAVSEARALVEAASGSDALAVVITAARPKALLEAPTADHEKIHALLDDLEAPLGGSLDVTEALWRAGDILAAGKNPGKRLVLITDGQNRGWQLSAEGKWRVLAQRLGSLGAESRLVVRPLSLPEVYNNLTVSDIRASRDVVGTDRPVQIEIELTNTGTAALTGQGVELFIDGQLVRRRPAQRIEPGAKGVLQISHHFTQPGRHVLEATVRVDDDLPGDDTRRRLLDVEDRLKVLVIDGTAGPESAGANIAQALSPQLGPEAPETHDMLIDTEVVAAADIESIQSFEPYSAIILADVPRLPEGPASRLLETVARGTGLLIAPGERALLGDSDPARPSTFYNDWRDPAGRSVLPGRLAGWEWSPESPPQPDAAGFRSGVLAKLRRGGSGVHRWLMTGYWRLEPASGDPDEAVVGRLSTGEPLLMRRRYGEGSIMLLATAPQRPETNLASLACFPVLMHEAVYTLADAQASRANLSAGARLVMDLSRRRGSGAGGLQGTYYKQRDFQTPVLTRLDAGLNFEWGGNAPASTVPADRFSVRWSGQIQSDRTGEHVLSVWADDGVRLWIDEHKIIDRWQYDHREVTAKVQLEAGRKYQLRIDYREDGGAAGIRLSWKKPAGQMEVVAPEHLYPDAASSYAAVLGATMGIDELDIATPSGRTVRGRIQRTDQAVRLVCTETYEPGMYRIELPDGLAPLLPAMRDQGEGLAFLVDADAGEGELAPMSESAAEDTRNVLDQAGVGWLWARSRDELTASISGRIPGQEIWPWLVLAALAGALAETALARWIAAKRRVAAAQAIDLTAESESIAAFKRASRATSSAARSLREGAGV